MQLPISKAAVRLEEKRAAASNTDTFEVRTSAPPQVSDREVLPPAPKPGLLTIHGYVFLSGSSPKPRVNTPLVVFVESSQSTEPTNRQDSPPPRPVARRSSEESSPTFVVTSPGQEVRFENTDDICHSFFSSSGPNAFDLGVLNPGESKLVGFEHEGFVQVYCTLHAGKQMSLLVAPTPLHALVGADGSFAIPELSPGDYTLTAWGEGLRPRKVHVEVTQEAPKAILVDLEPSDLGEGE